MGSPDLEDVPLGVDEAELDTVELQVERADAVADALGDATGDAELEGLGVDAEDAVAELLGVEAADAEDEMLGVARADDVEDELGVGAAEAELEELGVARADALVVELRVADAVAVADVLGVARGDLVAVTLKVEADDSDPVGLRVAKELAVGLMVGDVEAVDRCDCDVVSEELQLGEGVLELDGVAVEETVAAELGDVVCVAVAAWLGVGVDVCVPLADGLSLWEALLDTDTLSVPEQDPDKLAR